MTATQSSALKLEVNLFDGITLVSLLLRMGHSSEAASLARQLMVHFPQALPLHVAVGRALSIEPLPGENARRAAFHLRRVLDADPDNWRMRLETALLYLRSGTANHPRAGEELWLAVQSAPDNLWLRRWLEKLPEHPAFVPARRWLKAVERNAEPEPGDIFEDDAGGLARLYLRRRMPWMAIQYFEKALSRFAHNQSAPLSLKTGLLLAFCQNDEEKRASALASELLLEQPQLILPRLFLTSFLGRSSLNKNPENLNRILEPVWKADPFLERATEMLDGAGFTMPEGLWVPRGAMEQGSAIPVRISLETLDPIWLEDLLRTARHQEDARREVGFNLRQADEAPVIGLNALSAAAAPKGDSGSDIREIAAKLAEVESLLYGKPKPPEPIVAVPKGGATTKKRERSAKATDFNLALPRDHKTGILEQTTVLLVSSERNLLSKYGANGYAQIKTMLQELVQVMRRRGFDSRLLIVDSGNSLRENGFDFLDPVRAHDPELVCSLINAALPGEAQSSTINVVFIIGGPDIIPFWKLSNPSFDSDREVFSDNPYGSQDSTYLLPERIVGRLPDDGRGDISFFLRRLREVVARQRADLVSPKIAPSLPLRVMDSIIPARARAGLQSIENGLQFEQKWFKSASGEKFLDKNAAARWSPFFYSAEAWKRSTDTLRSFINSDYPVTLSPPTNASSLNPNLLRSARLLHFNLHGFRDNPNWYGQAQGGRIMPSISSLPLAYTPALSSEIEAAGAVVFSEACYSGNLINKGVNDSIALSFLERGAAAVVSSTVISYGSAGPELSCASHLAYYFWKGILRQGYSFGQALQSAKTEYTRARLAAGHNLTGDDAKTLLEFVMLGDPTIGLRATGPNFVSNMHDPPWGEHSPIHPKGWFLGNREEDLKLKDMARGWWDKLVRPRTNYQPIQYNRLPPDLLQKIERVLEWLLPEPISNEAELIQALVDMSGDYRRPGSNTFRVQSKGGDGAADSGTPDFIGDSGQVLLSGQRSLNTEDGYRYRQTFHLATDFEGEQMSLNLSRGRG